MKRFSLALILPMVLVACSGGNQVVTAEQARLAYLGLDNAVGKAMQLGFE